jgi:NTP pyrophosphatase (non-canonical NTP hydrolase)
MKKAKPIFTDKENEALNIAQEECAEVIQAISKIRRFGLESIGPNGAFNNRDQLEAEMGDVIALFDILVTQGLVRRASVIKATEAQKQRWKS